MQEEEWKDNKHSKTDNRQIKATNRSMPESHHQKAYDIISEIASPSSSQIFKKDNEYFIERSLNAFECIFSG